MESFTRPFKILHSLPKWVLFLMIARHSYSITDRFYSRLIFCLDIVSNWNNVWRIDEWDDCPSVAHNKNAILNIRTALLWLIRIKLRLTFQNLSSVCGYKDLYLSHAHLCQVSFGFHGLWCNDALFGYILRLPCLANQLHTNIDNWFHLWIVHAARDIPLTWDATQRKQDGWSPWTSFCHYGQSQSTCCTALHSSHYWLSLLPTGRWVY